jgi:hypothetical protein
VFQVARSGSRPGSWSPPRDERPRQLRRVANRYRTSKSSIITGPPPTRCEAGPVPITLRRAEPVLARRPPRDGTCVRFPKRALPPRAHCIPHRHRRRSRLLGEGETRRLMISADEPSTPNDFREPIPSRLQSVAWRDCLTPVLFGAEAYAACRACTSFDGKLPRVRLIAYIGRSR